MNSDRKIRVRINVSASGDLAVLAAQGAGTKIILDHINLFPSGGANVLTLESGSDVIADYSLGASQGYTYDNTTPYNEVECGDNEAFNLTLGSATLVTGFALFRVIGEV